MATALVIENDLTDDIRRLGDWLTDAGLELSVVRPHAGEALPADLDSFNSLIVLGGGQNAYPDDTGQPGAAWFPQVEGLLRKAVRHRVPTLAICLGGQLLAQAHGGLVERAPSGPEIGPGLVARRDQAENDPLFAAVPFAPDVLQWHYDEITELPLMAKLLAASPRFPHQAFRLGDRAWGTQFHIECDTEMFAGWVDNNADWLREHGPDPERLVESVDAIMDDLFEVWQPFARRFADLALGRNVSTKRPSALPLLSNDNGHGH